MQRTSTSSPTKVLCQTASSKRSLESTSFGWDARCTKTCITLGSRCHVLPSFSTELICGWINHSSMRKSPCTSSTSPSDRLLYSARHHRITGVPPNDLSNSGHRLLIGDDYTCLNIIED